MKRCPKCEQIKNDPIIVCKERRSKMIFENPQRREVRLLKVDECAIQEGLRCDYAMTAEENIEEFYIELKGCDVRHAFEQLEASIQILSDNPQKQPKICFIISTRSPSESPETQKMKKLMKNKYQAKLIIKNCERSYTLN